MDTLDHAPVSKEEEQHKRLLEIGNELLQQPPSSKEELLEKLDAEERQKRALEIGNELLQHPPSSKEELMEKLDAMGLFSNTKERNFPKTSKEQRERKNSPSQKEALDSVSVSKRSDLPKTSKQQCKRKNLPSQEEKSADKVVREHGVDLVGCRVRVWWPIDEMFYEGHITSFDQSEKKHTVNYDDGDQEILNLTNETGNSSKMTTLPILWVLPGFSFPFSSLFICSELVFICLTYWMDVIQIQESLPGSSDIFDMPLSCIIDSYRHTRKKKKALNVVDDVAVLTPGTESKKIVHSKAKLYRRKATDDPVPSTMTMQQSKVNKVEGSESGVEGNPVI